MENKILHTNNDFFHSMKKQRKSISFGFYNKLESIDYKNKRIRKNAETIYESSGKRKYLIGKINILF